MDYNEIITDNRERATELAKQFKFWDQLATEVAAGADDEKKKEIGAVLLPQPDAYRSLCAEYAQMRFAMLCTIIETVTQYINLHSAIEHDTAFQPEMRRQSALQVVEYDDRVTEYIELAGVQARYARIWTPDKPIENQDGQIAAARQKRDPRLQTAQSVNDLVLALSQDEIQAHFAICAFVFKEIGLHLGQAIQQGGLQEAQSRPLGMLGVWHQFHFETAGLRANGMKEILGLSPSPA